MADLWYAKVKPDGVVYKVYCDDHEPVQAGDIPLDPTWYWGQAPGIIISDRMHGFKYTVENGRLKPRYDNSREMESIRAKIRAEVDEYSGSPILSKKKKDKISDAKKEAHDHIDGAINENEVWHTRVKGY